MLNSPKKANVNMFLHQKKCGGRNLLRDDNIINYLKNKINKP